MLGLVRTLTDGGELPPIGWDAIHGMNAQHAADHPAGDKAETLALLRQNTAEAAGVLRQLDDGQLERSSAWGLADDAPITAEGMVRRHMIGHAREHLADVRAALA